MPREITLNAVGDVWFGDHPVCIGHGVASVLRKNGAGFLFSRATELLAGADLTFCNLESVLSDSGKRAWSLPSIEMRGSPAAIGELQAAGFNVVNIANNHMMQHGAEAFRDTEARLVSAGIQVAGVDGPSGASRATTMRVNGVDVTFVGYSLRAEEYFAGKPLYSQRERGDDVVEEIRALRAQAPRLIVCSLHWGDEYIKYPSREQRELAYRICDAGADVILGHHPHVLQGWERRGNAAIFYSLGNFVFDLWPYETRKAAIVRLRLVPGSAPSVEIVPIWINESYQPVLAEGAVAREVHADLAELQPGGELGGGAEYRQLASAAQRQIRRSSHEYFFKNLNRYSINMLVQSIGRTALRRLTGH